MFQPPFQLVSIDLLFFSIITQRNGDRTMQIKFLKDLLTDLEALGLEDDQDWSG